MAQQPVHALERWARGRDDYRKLRESDYVVVSVAKSGRTWLNVMISKYFQLRYNLPDYITFRFDNLHRQNPAVPKVILLHDTYIRIYTKCGDRKTPFYSTPTLLLIRHPADVAVSLYFHWRYRMQAPQKGLNRLPAHGAEVGVFDFVMRDTGLPSIVTFLNEWARERQHLANCLTVRYEDLRADPRAELGRVLRWMGQNPSDAEIDAVVEFASFENLKKLEAKDAFGAKGSKGMTPGDVTNPDSFKVRRAKVGGYRDYFDDDQARQIEDYIRKNLDPSLGYAPAS